ncbi:MAG: thioredoxin family protein [Acidobacteriota bacterium]
MLSKALRSAPASATATILAAAAGFSILAALLAAPFAFGQMVEKATVDVVADRTSYAPGETVRLAAMVELESHWHVNSHTPSFDYLIPTTLELDVPEDFGDVEYTYPLHELQTFAFTEEPIAVYDGAFPILAAFDLPEDAAAGPMAVTASFLYQACDDRQCLPPVTVERTVELAIGAAGESTQLAVFGAGPSAGASTGSTAAAEAGVDRGLLLTLLLGLVGGLILNAMPCVLPVLSLKVFGLVKSAGQGRSHLVMGALATTAGVLVSFWLLAAAAILAAQAGAAVGWGIQFQQPAFVAFLAVIVVLFSLNMWGLFEIILPQGLAQLGGSGAREGLAGHFASGLFATLMATPCSAPFLGTAIGFALAQPASVIFLVFTAIGLGLALPYLALAAFPRAAGILPKPGAWMNTFRGVMGFLLAAAAVWLFYVLAGQISSERLAFVQLTLLALALFTWMLRGARAGSAWRKIAIVGVAATACGTIVLAAGAPPASQGGAVTATALHDWIPFDEQEAERLTAEGRMVFIDFTADWCLTCKATERAVIETQDIAAAFERHGVVPMKGDWTNRDDVIAEFLSRYGRSAVPFYILYRPGQDPHAFGEVLTKGGLIDVLDASAALASAG